MVCDTDKRPLILYDNSSALSAKHLYRYSRLQYTVKLELIWALHWVCRTWNVRTSLDNVCIRHIVSDWITYKHTCRTHVMRHYRHRWYSGFSLLYYTIQPSIAYISEFIWMSHDHANLIAAQFHHCICVRIWLLRSERIYGWLVCM